MSHVTITLLPSLYVYSRGRFVSDLSHVPFTLLPGFYGYSKGKVVLLQARCGPEGG